MSRQEFLQRLRDTLTGEVPGNVIEENIRYYDDYIRTETAGGQTEDEVTGAIGDPRLRRSWRPRRMPERAEATSLRMIRTGTRARQYMRKRPDRAAISTLLI